MAKLDYGHEHGVSDGGTAPVKGLDTLSHSIECRANKKGVSHSKRRLSELDVSVMTVVSA